MEDCNRESLGNILTLERRPAKILPDEKYTEIGIYSHGRGIFHKAPRMGIEVGDKDLYLIQKGDFIFQITFAWEGAVGLASLNEDGLYGSVRFPTFRVNEKICLPKYLVNYFRTREGRNQLVRISPGSAGRNRVLNLKRIPEIEIPLPPLEEQRRIVARIEELAAKIEEARSIKSNIQKEIYKLLLAEYNNITMDVKNAPMREVAPLVRRPIQVDLSNLYYELGIRSFGKGTFHKPPINGAELGTKKIFRIKENDLLFNIVFAWEGAVAVAQSIDDGRVGSHRFLTCVPKQDLATSTFLCFHFLTENGLEQLLAASPGSAGRNRTLGIQALENILVPLPPIDRQVWFTSLVNKLNTLNPAHRQINAALDALLPSILDRAFKGEL